MKKQKRKPNYRLKNSINRAFGYLSIQIYIKVLKVAEISQRLRRFEVCHKNRYTLNLLSHKHDKIHDAQTHRRRPEAEFCFIGTVMQSDGYSPKLGGKRFFLKQACCLTGYPRLRASWRSWRSAMFCVSDSDLNFMWRASFPVPASSFVGRGV